jgi:diaminopimelate epimerase
MQAQGNDFVILDDRASKLPELTREFVRGISERRYGIGCDQLLVIFSDDKADIQLRIFNNDGSEAGNCGNGLRCVASLLLDKGPSTLSIRIIDRIVRAEKHHDRIRVHMGAATVTDRTGSHVDVEIGNPHRIFFEATEKFPEDRNIEIISGQIGDDVYVDIIERGIGHTPSCGSGACAVAAAIWIAEEHTRPQTIHMPGGDVVVSGTPESIILEGPVSLVFTGKYHSP